MHSSLHAGWQIVCHSTQYTPRVSNAIALHFPTVFSDFPSCFSYLFPGIPPFSSIFPPCSTIFLPFLSFFSYLVPGIPPFSPCFQRFSFVFSYLFPVIPPFSNDFPSFSLVFSSLFPAGVNGPRGNRSLPSPLCVVVHAPQKSSMYPPFTATNFEILAPYATTTPQTP